MNYELGMCAELMTVCSAAHDRYVFITLESQQLFLSALLFSFCIRYAGQSTAFPECPIAFFERLLLIPYDVNKTPFLI